ncbi:MAG TPA: peptide chain release factor N(5)-glutamine methyltransferase [Terriglobales bacterium]
MMRESSLAENTLKGALSSAVDRLTAAHIGSPRMNAELLLMFVLGCDRAYLFSHPERELTNDELIRYDEAIAQRASGIPAQYITGHQEFWGIDFIVSPAVLIPRPETEHLIETVLELAPSLTVRNAARVGHPPDKLRIIDVGTGSGCIAIALAKELPDAEIHAVDISADALEIARANAARHEFANKINFRQGDLLTGFEPGHVDLVVSNPPYVGESEADTVQLEVRKFEPRNAVFAGHTGLEIIQRLVPQASRTLKPGGWLVMEISGTIADGARLLLKNWDEVRTINDLQGIPRVIAAQKPAGNS